MTITQIIEKIYAKDITSIITLSKCEDECTVDFKYSHTQLIVTRSSFDRAFNDIAKVVLDYSSEDWGSPI